MYIPTVEWWDESFLTKEIKEARMTSGLDEKERENDYSYFNLTNNKTFKYVQHPVPVKPLGGLNDQPVALSVYLTKKERKRLRRKAREEREKEKRDLQMMGLIKAPEPKLKLSNFMKILGDQAVADPSKIERKVIQQVRERQIAHEMRNLKAKLTPAQRKAKKAKKFNEDVSKQVYVSLFRVRDLSSVKQRFKIDVNAQQWGLTGSVLICKDDSINMVLVEGGRKGIKRFNRLMLHRIKWDNKDADKDNDNDYDDNEDDDGDYQEEDEDEDNVNNEQKVKDDFDSKIGQSSGIDNRCDLLWQGFMPKRSFHSFRFQVI